MTTDPDFITVDVPFESAGEDAEKYRWITTEVDARNLGINRLEFKPGQRGRVHRHEGQEEYYLVLSGELTMIIEGDEHTFATGTLAKLAPGLRRQSLNRGDVPAVVLAVGAHGVHEGRDAVAWADWDEGGPGRPPGEIPEPADLEV
jgi:uncharacterized cupin superfamily protein